MKRYDFIKNTGLLAGGLLLQGNRLFANKGTNEKIKIAVIGCGDRGQGLLKVLQDLQDEFLVVAYCDVLDFRIQQTAAIKNAAAAKAYKNYRSLLDAKNVEAVIISVPLNLHYQIASDALKAGKHVYLEKTMTYNINQASQLVKLSRANPKLTLQVGHQYRYTPLFFKVKEMIEKDYLGKVTQIDCRWDRNWNWRRKVPAGYTDRQINWRMYKEYSGGLVAELLSHQIDFINWAFNTHPDVIMATGGIDNFKDGRETFDNVQAVLRYNQGGMIGNFGATCSNEHDGFLFKIKGTKGTVHLLFDEGTYYPEKETKKKLETTVDGVTGATKLEWNKDGGIPITKEIMKDGSWYALKDFYNSILNKTYPSSNVITGATTAICVHLANHSAYNKTINYWKPEYNFKPA